MLRPTTFILIIHLSHFPASICSLLTAITSLQWEVRSWTNNAFDSCLYWCMRFFATLAINQTWTLKAKLGLNNILRVGQAL